MEERNGSTKVEVIIVAIVVVFLILAVPPISKLLRQRSYGGHCGTNLKGLGTACTVYANDYDDEYPQLPGTGPWSKRLGFDFDIEQANFGAGGAEEKVSRTITASWYLLVREADVSPKSFICPQSQKQPFDGTNAQKRDIIQLWDFGYNPHVHVTYAYHNPYGKFPPLGVNSAAFAIAADMSPWFVNGDLVLPSTQGHSPQIITLEDKTSWKSGNSQAHEGAGQMVLFADGHTSWEMQPNIGVKNDNIYTFWPAEENPTEQDRQGGTAPTSRSPENDAKSKDDSFLAI